MNVSVPGINTKSLMFKVSYLESFQIVVVQCREHEESTGNRVDTKSGYDEQWFVSLKVHRT